MEIRRSASTVSRARGPRLCRRTWEWWFKVRGHSGGSVIREEPPFIWLHLWFSWRQPFDNAAEHVPASIREFTVCVPDPGKTPPIFPQTHASGEFFQKTIRQTFPLVVSLQGSWERNIEEKRKNTTLFHDTPTVFPKSRNRSKLFSDRLRYTFISQKRKKEKGKLRR